MNAKQLVFVSHIAEDAVVADWLKDTLNRDFLKLFEVFVSSDTEAGVPAGENWLDSVHDALGKANVLITLCSPRSIDRPWINFEVGAAWIMGKPIIPVCHSGLEARALPLPLALRQGCALGEPNGIRRLYEGLAREFGFGTPQQDFEQLAAQAPSVEGSKSAIANDEQHIARRLRQALEGSRFQWRSLERVAIEAGVSEEVAADVLRGDDDVRFGKGKSKQTIVGLESRLA